jgi:hemolysin activation/secretion protein
MKALRVALSCLDARAVGWAVGAAIGAAAGAVHAAPPPAPPSAAASPSAIAGGLIDKGVASENTGTPTPGAPITSATPKAKTAPSGPAFLVTAITFSPSRFLRPAQLDRLAAPLIGHKVTLGELQHVADQVNALYAKRGIITGQAFVPPQRVSGGVAHIELVESKLDRLSIKAGAYTRAGYAAARISSDQGEVLDIARLQQQIGRFNRTNDTQIQASLTPGSQSGTTDILLSLRDPPRNSLQLFVDNNGYDSTGRVEGGLSFRRNDLVIDGDHASLYLLGSGGSITGNAAYNVPADIFGGRLGVSYARSDIHVISGAASSVGVIGVSNTGSVNLAIPVVSQDDWSLSGVATGSIVQSSDTLSGKTIDDSLIGKATFGLSATRQIWRLARLTGDLQGSWASVDYRTGQGPGVFWEANADFDLATAPWRGLTLHLSGVGEYIDRKAVPGTQLFQLGGYTSVRGYAPGTATGYAGYAVQSELHAALPWLKRYADPFVFADTGEAYTPAGQLARADGAGVGFILVPIRHLSLQASYAFALDRLSASQYGDRLDMKAVISF